MGPSNEPATVNLRPSNAQIDTPSHLNRLLYGRGASAQARRHAGTHGAKLSLCGLFVCYIYLCIIYTVLIAQTICLHHLIALATIQNVECVLTLSDKSKGRPMLLSTAYGHVCSSLLVCHPAHAARTLPQMLARNKRLGK